MIQIIKNEKDHAILQKEEVKENRFNVFYTLLALVFWWNLITKI